MYAQVVRVQLRPDTLEAVTAVFRDEVVPAARGERGYVSAYLFIDREANRGMSLSLWETEADVAALAASGFYGEKVTKVLPFAVGAPERQVYEVVFQG